MKKIPLFLSGYFVAIIGLFFYSYTQVDLSLTFSRASIFQTIEKGFQYIGYFNRPLSTDIYTGLLTLLFLFYFGFLYLAKVKQISRSTVWLVIFATTAILLLTYNAFSYDFFNYIFYGKIITHYHQNPYLVKALDFPREPMLSFMHWTHNTYPYGPIWLVLTVPLSFLGMQYFLPTFFLYKLLAGACFIGTVYFLEKILKRIAPDSVVQGLILFALNPLVYIEMLVSAHNDGAMIFFAIFGVYLLLQKKWVFGLISILLSIFTKEATAFLILPALLYAVQIIFKKQFVSENMFLWGCALSMIGGFLFAISKIEVQPWYFVWFFPFIIVFKIPRSIFAVVIGFSFGLMLRYVPFLYQGDWNGLALVVKNYVTIVTPIIFGFVYGIWYYFTQSHGKA